MRLHALAQIYFLMIRNECCSYTKVVNMDVDVSKLISTKVHKFKDFTWINEREICAHP